MCGSLPLVTLLLKFHGDVQNLNRPFSGDSEMHFRSIAGPALQALCPNHIFFRLGIFVFLVCIVAVLSLLTSS